MSALHVRRCGYALGAEITGLDISRPLDRATIAAIRQAVLEHIVVSFPGQDLTPEEMAVFCGQFGELDDNRANPGKRCSGEPHVISIANDTSGRKYSTADDWHTDHSFGDHPATLTFLLAKDLPDTGGNTMFANMYAAYETLSPAFREMIEPLEGVFDFKLSGEYLQASPELQARYREQKPVAVHRLVRIHPETGRKALYFSDRVRNFVGMTAEETQPLLDFLLLHSTRYELTYRYRWSVNDLVMWDQRCSFHIAVQDYDEKQLRRMFRCTLLGPKSGHLLNELASAQALG